MSLSGSSELVSFDADRAVEAVLSVAGDDVHLCVEYTAGGFNVLYADELTLSLYGDETRMQRHFSEVHDYVNIDFAEMDLFEEIMRAAGSVRAFVTIMDHVSLVRVFTAEREGLFITLDPEADVSPVVDAAREAIE